MAGKEETCTVVDEFGRVCGEPAEPSNIPEIFREVVKVERRCRRHREALHEPSRYEPPPRRLKLENGWVQGPISVV